MPSFVDKLRMDNLYPTMPSKKIRGNPLFDRAMQLDRGMNNRMDSIYGTPSYSGIPPSEPTKPMDVIFQPNIGEQAREMAVARDVHGIDLARGSLTPYQAGQLSLRDRQLQNQQQIAERKMTDSEKRTLINEVRENKRLNDADKMEIMGRIESGQITQRGDIESRLVGERGGEARQNIAATGTENRTTQAAGATQRESLAGIQARHAKELEETKAGLRPTGNQRIITQKDAEGNITGAMNIRDEEIRPTSGQTGSKNSALMYGPNGEGPFSVPIEQTDDAQARGMTFSRKK